MTDLNPQHKQMSDESMVRNLDAQARAIWPQESRLFERYGLSGAIRVLDAGCGTGEGASRLAALYPQAAVLGVDILDHHLALARERYAALAPRLRFEHQSVFELNAPEASFDLTVCRHVVHSIPHPERVIAELARVTRPGGWLHLIPEDYGMLHFPVGGRCDVREFWHRASAAFGAGTNTDLFVGRHGYGHMRRLGLEDIAVDYVVVDTLRVPRETFAQIMTAWRDGYVESIGELTPFSSAQATACFDQMIADILDPERYAAWMVPVVAGRIPARA
ncbi:MAG TPA: methyltransferase domain-containing protein [Candidatus Eisenbacteria bacterium]|nr:methyltransferase domain-containing protein [Candidatus Eisenbacteria bacterium]